LDGTLFEHHALSTRDVQPPSPPMPLCYYAVPSSWYIASSQLSFAAVWHRHKRNHRV